MSAEGALVAVLEADAAVAAIVGEKIYAHRSPSSVSPPYIVYGRVSTRRDGRFSGGDSLSQPRIQLDLYGGRYGEAKALADAVRAVLNGYKGGEIRGCHLENEQDGFQSETAIPRVIQDYQIWVSD